MAASSVEDLASKGEESQAARRSSWQHFMYRPSLPGPHQPRSWDDEAGSIRPQHTFSAWYFIESGIVYRNHDSSSESQKPLQGLGIFNVNCSFQDEEITKSCLDQSLMIKALIIKKQMRSADSENERESHVKSARLGSPGLQLHANQQSLNSRALTPTCPSQVFEETSRWSTDSSDIVSDGDRSPNAAGNYQFTSSQECLETSEARLARWKDYFNHSPLMRYLDTEIEKFSPSVTDKRLPNDGSNTLHGAEREVVRVSKFWEQVRQELKIESQAGSPILAEMMDNIVLSGIKDSEASNGV